MALDTPLVVTAGEPAGIGPELCLALAHEPLPCEIVVVSDPELLQSRAAMTGSDVRIAEVSPDNISPAQQGELRVIPVPFPEDSECGKLNPANAPALLDGLRKAANGCMDGRFAGLVTAPLQKSVINDAGIPFIGHTEFLADITDADMPVMLLVAGDLRVALVTTHLPLREVPDQVSEDGLHRVLDVLLEGLHTMFGFETPEIVVCGLNPHAGEGGHLGSEDDDIIAPVIADYAARGHKVRGPLAADTAFTPAAGHKDAILAMYHDQGLPVLKYAAFGHAVNVTLGLPIIRTSVDHGTALDIAGTGKADTGSLLAAVRLAAELAAQ